MRFFLVRGKARCNNEDCDFDRCVGNFASIDSGYTGFKTGR